PALARDQREHGRRRRAGAGRDPRRRCGAGAALAGVVRRRGGRPDRGPRRIAAVGWHWLCGKGGGRQIREAAMPIEHETKLRTQDGHEAGHVKHAIWGANGRKITEYVIATGGLLGHDVIVSPEVLEGAARKGNEIV